MTTIAQPNLCISQRAAPRLFTRLHNICNVRCVRRHSFIVQQQINSTACSSSSSTAQQPQDVQQPLANVKAQHIVYKGAFLSLAALLATGGAAHAAAGVQLYNISELVDASVAHKLEAFLRPLFTVFTLLYIIRIPMTWYPSIDGTKLPWLLAYAPTEPILKATRKVLPLVGGVDVTPIVWVAMISFFNEILLGPQGILMLIQRESGGL